MAHASLQTRRRSAAARLHEPRRIAQTLTHCPTTCEEALLATQASHRVMARTVTKRDVIGSPPFSPFPSHALRELGRHSLCSPLFGVIGWGGSAPQRGPIGAVVESAAVASRPTRFGSPLAALSRCHLPHRAFSSTSH